MPRFDSLSTQRITVVERFFLLFFDANVSDKTKIAVTLVFGAVALLTKKPEYSGYEINNVCVLLLLVCFFISL